MFRGYFIWFIKGLEIWKLLLIFDLMENKEKVFKITTWYSAEDSKDTYIPESKLKEKHINMFAGELIKQYEELPEKSKNELKKLMTQYLSI